MSGLLLNLGSGQRPFGLPRRVYNHTTACCICGISVELHRQDTESYRTGPVLPRIFDPHKFVGYGEWINVDCQPKWNPDVLADISGLPMFDDGSASVIVLHHVIEHFGCGEADGVLREAHRLLAPGGSLLIFIPNLRTLAIRWITDRIDDYTFFVNCMGAYMGDEADRHRWHYTERSLRETLERCGQWSAIKPFDWREIQGADLARDFWILAVEAVK